MADRVMDLLPPLRREVDDPNVEVVFSLWVAPDRDGHGNGEHLLYRNWEVIARSGDIDLLLMMLEDRVRLEIALWADDEYLFVHAGVVGIRGRAVVIPGRSGCGKSTLVSALVNAGADYYSDDMAVFDAEGRVLPYPVRLALWEADGNKVARPVAAGRTGTEPLSVGLILVSRYDADVRQWRPRAMSAARAVMALFDNTVAARRMPKQALQRLKAATLGAKAYKGRRGEAEAIIDWIHRHAG